MEPRDIGTTAGAPSVFAFQTTPPGVVAKVTDMHEQEPYVLIVVDMQPNFKASCDAATLAAVCREVETARQLGMYIMLLEIPYESVFDVEPFPPTHQCIMDLLAGYGRFVVQGKRYCDGSKQIVLRSEREGFPTTNTKYRVVGVNIDACVVETAKGLFERTGLPVEVVKAACNTDGDISTCWKSFDGLAGIVPV